MAVSKFGGKKHYVSMSTKYLADAYNITGKQARSIIAKTRFEIAKKIGGATNVGNIYANQNIGNINRLVYHSFVDNISDKNAISTTIVNGQPIVITQHDDDFEYFFKNQVYEKMENMIDKYEGLTSFKTITEAYFNGIITEKDFELNYNNELKQIINSQFNKDNVTYDEFIQQYLYNDSFKNLMNQYIQPKQTTYQEFKNEIEEFKRTNSTYLQGS